MKVTVECPVCKTESQIFPTYTEGKAVYPCGCEISLYDKVKNVEYTPDKEVENYEKDYEKLLDVAKKCSCEEPMDNYLTDEEWGECLEDAKAAGSDYMWTDAGTASSGKVKWNTFGDDEEIILDDVSEYDNVNNPFHYASVEYQPIDVSKDWTADLNSFNAICVHNILKYICRFNNKNGKEDLEKAKWYLNKLIEEYDG